VTVTVSQAAGPTAVDDDDTVAEDEVLLTYVLDNDSGDGMVLDSVSDGAHGTASIGVDGYSIEYVPEQDFNGTDVLTYLVCDKNGNCSTATLTITVTPVNDPPEAGTDAATADEDSPVTIDVLGNDHDLDGDTLSVSSVEDPPHGTATIEADGSITYVPDANYSGDDSFTYVLSDGQGGTVMGTVVVVVNPINDPPIAVDDSGTSVGEPVDVDVLLNDDGGEPDAVLEVSAAGHGTHGKVVVNSGQNVTYTPDGGFSGNDTFTYTTCQTPDAVSCDDAVVTIVVTRPVVDPTRNAHPDRPDPITTVPVTIPQRKAMQDPAELFPEPARSSGLPFTGSSVAALVLAGLVLVFAGVFLSIRRKSDDKTSERHSRKQGN
jgi:LPXTG-motif cell wall-anchored protein